MSHEIAASRPRIGALFRLQWEEAQGNWVLLYPEGMVKLNTSAGEILRRCDGQRSVSDLVADLEQAFATADLGPEVQGFLTLAAERGWVVLA